ncbi:MAG: hypothetical protein ACI9H6_000043 [Patiriisocius sp.]|jgi:hypothetical protein
MEIVLHKPHPPPTWDLVLEVNQNADPCFLRKAHLIITSYLTPDQIQRKRKKKGVHHFQLTSVGAPVDRLILLTVETETWPHLTVRGGTSHV